jgi:uncharacterized membrane protein
MTGAIGLGALADHWDGGHMGSGWAWSWMALLLLMVVAASVVAVLLARGRPRGEPPVDGARRARDLLMERFALGEIDAEEFDERSRRLR